VGYDAGYFDRHILLRNLLLIANANERRCFLASATKQMRTALFWVIMKRVMVILHRCFRTTYRSYLQGSIIIQESFCVTGQRSADPNVKRSRLLLNCLTLKMKTFLRNVRFNYSSYGTVYHPRTLEFSVTPPLEAQTSHAWIHFLTKATQNEKYVIKTTRVRLVAMQN
jgi:hypothetical protein